jgi:hypothetical protein
LGKARACTDARMSAVTCKTKLSDGEFFTVSRGFAQ